MITMTKVFNAEATAASGSSTSDPIDLRALAKIGVFSLQIEETGDGTGKWEYLLSNNYDPSTGLGDFFTPTGASDIVTAFVKTTGPGSDGKDIYSFTPEVSLYLKIKVTETGGADALASSAWLAIQ